MCLADTKTGALRNKTDDSKAFNYSRHSANWFRCYTIRQNKDGTTRNYRVTHEPMLREDYGIE